MRTLIACQTHIRTPEEAKLLGIWCEMRQLHDPSAHFLIVDNNSPLPLGGALYWKQWNDHRILHDDDVPKIADVRSIARFRDALGHPFHDGTLQRSGSDRGFIKMLEIAIASGYDKFAYIEMDVLFALPVASIFERMSKPCACGPLVTHGKFPETGLLFLDVEHIWKTDFIAKYNWKGSVIPEGEKRLWNILGDSLELLPLRGRRDGATMRPGELPEIWPDGIDFLTHAHMGVYADFLRVNGFAELALFLEK